MKQEQSSISLLINRLCCQVSWKMIYFKFLPEFPLLIQCLRYAFETWFGKIADAPGQLNQWTTATEPEWSRACDLHQEKHRIEKPVHCNYRGAWKAAVHGVAEGQTGLSDFTFTFHFHALEKEMATHSSVLAWRIPGMGEPGGLPSMRSHRVGHD